MSQSIAFVIEDDPQLSRVFSLAIEEYFDVRPILDGDEALERLKEETPRVIILDLNLPVVSGMDILSYIRADARLKDAIVILCTADVRQADALQSQADFVLLKPVSPMQLRQMVSRLS